jgi:hypothetical protein
MRISIAKAFSRFPAGRFREDGPFSGEAFREDKLLPLLRKHSEVVVVLDGVEGYGSSFLEEAFGGLVREKYFTADELKKRLKIETQDEGWFAEVWSDIEQPGPGRRRRSA